MAGAATTSEVGEKTYTTRVQLEHRHTDLMTQRSSYEARWKTAGSYILPMRPRFSGSDANSGNKPRNRIVNSTAALSLGIARSGMLDNMASPQRPWFELAVQDAAISSKPSVRDWLQGYRDGILGVLDRSNFYNELGTFFGDELVFGTGCMLVFEDADKLVRFEVLSIGSYALGMNSKGRVTTLVRELSMSAYAAANEFGVDRLDGDTKEALRAGRLSHSCVIRHIIEPNPAADADMLGSEYLPYREVYWQSRDRGQGAGADKPDWGVNLQNGAIDSTEDGILRVGGYHECPIIAGRWDRNVDDVYGTSCPGLMALGDIKSLQAMEKDKALGIEKSVDPPTQGPDTLDARDVSMMPGEFTQVPANSGKVEALHAMQFNLADVREEIATVEHRIRRAFMEDLFLMLAGDSRSTPPTAEEIRARERERAQVLGPIMERHSDDVFDPLIDRVSSVLMRMATWDWQQGQEGLLPFPPEELEDTELRVQYVSEVAMAQRMVALGSVERLLMMGGQLAEIAPETLDNLDLDWTLQNYAQTLGVDPQHLRPEEVVAGLREQRQAMEREMAEREQAPGMAKAARDLSETEVGGASALDQLAGVT